MTIKKWKSGIMFCSRKINLQNHLSDRLQLQPKCTQMSASSMACMQTLMCYVPTACKSAGKAPQCTLILFLIFNFDTHHCAYYCLDKCMRVFSPPLVFSKVPQSQFYCDAICSSQGQWCVRHPIIGKILVHVCIWQSSV